MEELKPGRDLDALIAEKVMGWKLEEHLGLRRIVWKAPPDFNRSWQDQPPQYSTDIAAAWDVVEKLRNDEFLFSINFSDKNKYDVEFNLNDGRFLQNSDTIGEAYEDTAPHAICLASLKAIGELK